MKIKLINVLVIFLLLGCLNQKSNEDEWYISPHNIISVEYAANPKTKVMLEKEEWERLINAYNSIETQKVNEEFTNGVVTYFFHFDIKTTEGNKKIEFQPWPRIGYNNIFYDVDVNEEFFDIIRELEEKYNITKFSWKYQLGSEGGFAYLSQPDCIVSTNFTVNQILEFMGYKERLDIDRSILAYLNSYDEEVLLNEFIYFDNFRIKPLEIIDGEVTTVIFRWLNEE